MLDLNAAVRTVAGVDLAGDDQDPLAFYVLPPPPRLAAASGSGAGPGGGAPDVQLLRFVRDGALSGGHLQLAVELAHPDGALDAARQALAEELHREVTLTPVPVTTASAELLFVGRDTTPDGGLSALLARSYGATAARLDAPHAAAFSVALTPEGVGLVEAALRSGGAPIGVLYRLGVEGLWPAQKVVARVDWGRVYDQFSLAFKEGNLFTATDVQKLTERLVESRAVTIQAVTGIAPGGADGAPAADLSPVLAWIQRELVERFCEPVMPLDRQPARASLGTFGEVFGVGASFAVKKLTQIERAVADLDFERAAVVARTWTATSHLADLLGGAPAADHISDAGLDHPFFARFGLHVAAARPLAESHLAEAVLAVAYGSAALAIRLTPEARDGAVDAWADASPDGTWTLAPTVTFADDSPLDPSVRVALPALSGAGRELTVDFDALLGLERIAVSAAPDPRVMLSRVTLEHRRGGELLSSADLSFAAAPASPGAPSAAAEPAAWFRDRRPGDLLTASPAYLLADGRLVKGAPLAVDTRVLRLPPAFPGALTVEVFSDDDWTGLERVIVTLQKAADQPAATLVFDQPGKMAAVALDLPDPADRSFRYKTARTFASGAVEEDDWMTTDQTVVLAGRVAANKLVVDVTPVGPELPTVGIVLVEVELSYIDAASQVRAATTAEIRARADSFRWEVAIKDPQRRAYEYRVTVYRTSGAKTAGPWTASSERILPIPLTAA